jgi:DNA-binding transcriptional regulator YiaG
MKARIPRRWSFRIDACTGCGSARLEWITTRIEVPYADRSGRAGTASATTPMSRCRDCGAESLPAESMWHGHAAVCRAKGLLAPQDIVDRRRALGLTQEELAELTGLGIASIRRWEAGTGTQNVANDRALRWAFGEPPPRAKSADGIRARKR